MWSVRYILGTLSLIHRPRNQKCLRLLYFKVLALALVPLKSGRDQTLEHSLGSLKPLIWGVFGPHAPALPMIPRKGKVIRSLPQEHWRIQSFVYGIPHHFLLIRSPTSGSVARSCSTGLASFTNVGHYLIEVYYIIWYRCTLLLINLLAKWYKLFPSFSVALHSSAYAQPHSLHFSSQLSDHRGQASTNLSTWKQ